uniref:glycosyltransferase family 4 protein n=1 Tax=Eubacterium cellulosolvens TaxID=29322 RepID=UPI000485CCB7|nr:glycosyltransferase family 4 protein [[Eubacterium] cellulosolvens]
MFGHKRIPSREGGIEVVVDELSTRMAGLGHHVTVYNRGGRHVSGAEFASSEMEETEKTGMYRGVRVRKVPTIDRKGMAAVSSSFTGALITAMKRFDVVHIHAEGPAFMCLLPKLLRKRVIVTIHGLDWQRAKWGGFASWYIRTGERQAAKHADQIIVLSRGVQQYFMDTYGRETVFIPNGVNRPEKVDAKLITENYGLKKDDYVLYLGRIVPEKGLRYLIHAWNQIHTGKKLVIAGGSSDTDEFMQELKEAAGENVIFTGFIQGRILEELYSNAYIYTLPSDLEGMPLSLLEAMSFGNCCLTSDITECTDVVESHAESFRKSDVEDLRLHLQRLLDNPALVGKYKKEAADFICKKYNWDEIVKKTLDLYRRPPRH